MTKCSNKTFAPRALRRLARRVVDGDVVFFIGAGFSIDSERNTAPRLMQRLLIRLLAMCEALGEEGKVVQNRLKQTFGLAANGPQPFPFREDDVDRLAEHYYEANDWFCGVFGRLLAHLAKIPPQEREAVWEGIANREEEIRRTGGPNGPLDPVPFDDLPREFMEWVRNNDEQSRLSAGKALFLDTMGFCHPGIMGGEPLLSRPDEVAESFGDRLLPRHHVIARFAREGFCTATLTTNYDLLLEGAYRLAGFHHDGCEEFGPPTYFRDFARIASPGEFFTKGKAHRTATVVKMHGCTECYREIRRSGCYENIQGSGCYENIHRAECFRQIRRAECFRNIRRPKCLRKVQWDNHELLRAYLRSLVFTYREIQNWRADSWAADYLRTLLRTRTVVFSGYSLRDPVIHDTLRTVYEEMAREMSGAPKETPVRTGPAKAPAFLFAGVEDRNEFYGMEVLRAASAAVGIRPRPLDLHPNYLRFHFRKQPGFPHLDELFRWLFHTVFRMRQLRCLETDLYSMAALLLGRPRPDAQLKAVRRAFRRLWATELKSARRWDDSSASRSEHAGICSWTDGFGNALLREFACTDQVRRCRGPDRQLALMRSLPWHYPTTQNSGWTCWSAVVELAVRHMLAAALPGNKLPRVRRPPRAGECLQPTILFSPGADAVLPQALTIRFGGFGSLYREAPLLGHVQRRVIWELLPGDAPWPITTRHERPAAGHAASDGHWAYGCLCRRAPDADVIWDWAWSNAGTQDEAREWLGTL